MQDYLTTGIPTVSIGEVGGIAKRSIFSGEPELDVQQDWILLDSSEENGTTTLRFYRKLNTTDQQNDVIIQVKKRDVMSVMYTVAFVIILNAKFIFHPSSS